MKTLLFASAFLLSAAGADGSTGGAPDRPDADPNTNPDSVAAANMVAEGAPVASVTGPEPTDFTELDEDFARRLAAERAEFDRIRALIPTQEVELRPCPGASHLGVIIGTPDGIRCVALADWRTDRLCLKAGDHAQILVLAGEGLKTWEFYREQEARSKEQLPLGQVKTVSLEPAAAQALIGGLAAGAAPAVDPLEATQPTPVISQAEKDADEASSISSGAGNHDVASDSAVGTGA